VRVRGWLGKGVNRWWIAAFGAAVLLLPPLFLASWALARSGSLDRGFGANGLVVEDLESGGPWPGAVVVQSGGRVVVGTGGQIVRFRRDGVRDSSFSARSLPLTDLVGLPGDRLIRLGDNELERMLPDGARDPGFARASGGTVSAPGIELGAIAVDPEERIVAVGHDANTGALAVTRFLPGGQLDLGFGSGGVVRTAISAPGPTNLDIGRSVSVGVDGKILVGGSAGSEEDCTGAMHCWGPYLDAVVLRYLSDGTLDGSFARGGIFEAKGGGWGSAESVVPLADGGLLFLPGPPTGALEAGYQFPLAVVALTPQGERDSSFSRDGIGAWVPRVHGKRAAYKGATRMLVTPRGQIVACGWVARSEYRPSKFWVGLLSADGRPVRSFGSNGSAWTPMPSKRDGYAASLALGPGGTVYLAGSLGPDLALARYHLN